MKFGVLNSSDFDRQIPIADFVGPIFIVVPA